MQKKTLLLAKYMNIFERDNRSKVFAPLAECYRQLSMLEEAKQVLKKGIDCNPDYILGYLVLSKCYLDEEKYFHAYNILKDKIEKNLENLSLVEHYAFLCTKLNYNDEALKYYKIVLFHKPKDTQIREKVDYLEEEVGWVNNSYKAEIKQEASQDTDPDDWSRMDLTQDDFDDFDGWQIKSDDLAPVMREKSSLENFHQEIKEYKESLQEPKELTDESYVAVQSFLEKFKEKVNMKAAKHKMNL